MKEKTKDVLIDLGSGAAIGISGAIPGVSGGTIATQLHVYDKHLDHMNNLRKQFGKNLLILLPLLIGIIIGFIPAMILFKKTFEGFMFGTITLFAGLIIGGLPGIFDEIKGKEFKKKYIIIFSSALLIAAAFGLISGLLTLNNTGINMWSSFNMEMLSGKWIDGGYVAWYIYPLMIPCGMIACAAFIVPGISGSMILLILGVYNPILATIDWIKDIFSGKASAPQIFSLLGIYLCLIAGIILGFFLIVRLLSYLMKKYRVASYYAVIGFIFGSLFSLYFNNQIVPYYQMWANPSASSIKPWFTMSVEMIIAGVLLVVGFLISYLIVRLGRKSKIKQEEIK